MKSRLNSRRGNYRYDFENDVYYVYPENRTYDSSYQIEDFIFDLDKNRKVIGVEILNASKIFHVPKVMLKNLIKGSMKILINKSYIKFSISMICKVRNSEKSSSLSVERIRPDFIEPMKMDLALV